MNKNKSAPFIIGLLTIIVSLSVVFFQYSHKQSKAASAQTNTEASNSIKTENTKTVTTTKSTTDTTKKSNEYTLADVIKHNSQSDCWTTINGGVYNVTPWIKEHPGGAEAIISLCGIDGSDAFNGQHGGERRPASELATFKIGTLK